MQNLETLTAAWMQKNGGARRFEKGVSSSHFHQVEYLRTRGIEVKRCGNIHYISRNSGRWMRIKRGELPKLVDSERVSQGLPPLRRAYA